LRGLLYVWPLVLLMFVDFPGVWVVLRVVLAIAAVSGLVPFHLWFSAR